MPAMIPTAKNVKIMHKIMGVPANMRKQPHTNKKDKVEDRLVFEDTTRVR